MFHVLTIMSIVTLIGKTIGLAALIFAGTYALLFGSQAFANAFNGSAIDKVLNPPITPYKYKESELWQAPSYWSNWEKNETLKTA